MVRQMYDLKKSDNRRLLLSLVLISASGCGRRSFPTLLQQLKSEVMLKVVAKQQVFKSPILP